MTDDRLAVIFTDRIMVINSDATVTGEVLFADTTPTLAAIGRGSVAILSESNSDLTESILTVYDKNARTSYSITLDEEHPITQAGRPSALAIGENTLYFWAGDHLFRLAGNGRQIFQIDLSHDTLAVLPESDDEVMICTPAYAYRLNEKDFVRIEEP